MHFFSQYRGLRRENYVLFFGRIVTNMGSMVWPMLTMILNQKLGMSAGNIAILTAVFGILMMPATLFGGKLVPVGTVDRHLEKLRAEQEEHHHCRRHRFGRVLHPLRMRSARYGDDRAHVCRQPFPDH